MANMITELCFNCGLCESVCPGDGISRGEETFVIDPAHCTECVGFYHRQQCTRVCPIECSVIDPNNAESEEALFERAKKLQPELVDTLELGPETSHFRALDRTLGTKLRSVGRRLGAAVQGSSRAS
jgi:Fe-S-cluster-containing dehydrogenase component